MSQLGPCPHVSRYFWICNFFFLDTASVHTYPANSAMNLDIFESALFESGKKKLWIQKYPDTCWRGFSVFLHVASSLPVFSLHMTRNHDQTWTYAHNQTGTKNFWFQLSISPHRVGGLLTKNVCASGTRLCQILDTYLHQRTEHVNCSMRYSIIISFQCFNNLHTKLVSEPGVWRMQHN